MLENYEERKILEAMRLAIQEAFHARASGEDPFGAVLLDTQNSICHSAHSQCRQLSDPTAHAEMVLIREYCQKNKLVYLKGYTIVCSGEPCVMCSGAIKWAKISRIIYSVPQTYIQEISGGKRKPTCESIVNTGKTKIEVRGNVLFEEGREVLKDYIFIPKDQ